MRKIFNRELLRHAAVDPRIHLVLADIGYGEIEAFAEAYPSRFINCGVAEQNMTGVACGLALEGKVAVTYSIANFPTLRCLEQIRNDVCYHHADVKIVVIGGGMAYGPLGVSHHSTEDLAIMRSLPAMRVLAPCDGHEARSAVGLMLAQPGPVYYRCGYKGEPDVHDGPVALQWGRALAVRQGSDATVIFCGTVGHEAKLAVDWLAARRGLRCRLLSMPSVKPLDQEAILAAARETGAILTVEEHNLCGGFGSAVAEVLMDGQAGRTRFRRLAIPDENVTAIGDEQWLRRHYGLDRDGIAAAVEGLLAQHR